MAHSPCFVLPLLIPLCSPFNPLLLTWNPPSCVRIRSPRSQVACKLTSPVPTLSPNPPPPNSQNPNYPAPHWDDLKLNPASSVRNMKPAWNCEISQWNVWNCYAWEKNISNYQTRQKNVRNWVRPEDKTDEVRLIESFTFQTLEVCI
jgi:hypothetical protein